MRDAKPEPEEARVRLGIRGRVQGVWFRGWTCETARDLGLVGSARNLPDGSVEVVAQGPRHAVEALVLACRKGPPSARVDALAVSEEAPGDDFQDFRIR